MKKITDWIAEQAGVDYSEAEKAVQ